MFLGCPVVFYIMNALKKFHKTDREYSLGPTDDLIRFWRSVVKGQGRSRPLKSDFVNTVSREILEQS